MELVANLGLDSAKALELLVELEESLDIEIGDDDAARLNTVGDIYAYLERLSPATA
jgi:acyl carrier protein